MQAGNTGTVSAYDSVPPTAASTGLKRFKIFVTVMAIVAVWFYARFGVTQPSPTAITIGAFATPQEFVARPGEGSSHINVRAGAGADYRVLYQLDRGAGVVGIARVTDAKGAYWIELKDGKSFAKESVLSLRTNEGT